jgi:general secretion pathway protein K
MRRGFAMIAAIWLIVIIGTVSMELAIASNMRRLAALNALDAARAQAAALGALEHASARLTMIQPQWPSDPWAHIDTVLRDTIALDSLERYHVGLRDANASLNLNLATEDELQRFFDALGLDDAVANGLAQCIADWRDADDIPHPRGAERDAYLKAGRAALPRNGPFRDVAELGDVMGVTPEILKRARPYLTVLGSGQVNLNAAPRPVVLALAGMSEEAVSVLERVRESTNAPPVASLDDLSLRLSPAARRMLQDAMPTLLARATFATREVEAVAEGWVTGGPDHAVVTALIVRTGTLPADPLIVWRRIE